MLLAEKPVRAELMNIDQLQHHARTIATQHRLAFKRLSNSLLPRLNENEQVLLATYDLITAAVARNDRIAPASDWLLDNFYLIEEQIRVTRRLLPPAYSNSLPRLAEGPNARLPRMYAIALELIAHTDGRADAESINAFITAYQTVTPLTLGELWALPLMMRLALIENLRRVAVRIARGRCARDHADHWANRMIQTVEHSPTDIVIILADMAREGLALCSAFVAELTRHLQGQNSNFSLAHTWLEHRLAEQGHTIEHLVAQEAREQAADHVSFGNSITSLRFLSVHDWRKFVTEQSVVEQILLLDPAGIYARMDFATRNRYRQAVEAIARRSRYSEHEVASRAIQLAQAEAGDRNASEIIDIPRNSNPPTSSRSSHVGYFLLDRGRPALESLVGMRLTFGVLIDKSRRHFPLAIYMTFIAILTAAVVASVVRFSGWNQLHGLTKLLLLPPVLLCATQLALEIINWLTHLSMPPQPLPRLDFEDGLPPEHRTLVAVPTMLTSAAGIDHLLEAIEIRFLANRDNCLHFALVTDFPDADQKTLSSDAALVKKTADGIAALNLKYQSERKDLFFLMHRDRRWNEQEQVWMGYERKRGKLADLNATLRGATDRFALIVGNQSILSSVKYVITLDTDTQLPRDTGRELAAAMAHPLNRPVLDSASGRVTDGYTILQPRVGISLPSATRSWFVRLYAGDPGIDPYTRVVSDLYQDLFHEGSFIGKGIYDVDAFERQCSDFPENAILSHDLLESCYGRSGLLSDVILYEDFPSSYAADAVRRHRWIRGDWQIAGWLLPKVRNRAGQRTSNPVTMLSRWKIADNLRRSLTPPAMLAVLLIGWLQSSDQFAIAATVFVMAVTFLPPVLTSAVDVFRKPLDLPFDLHAKSCLLKLGPRIAQSLLTLILMPCEAAINLDALIRTLVRMHWTHHRLLEWKTASDCDHSTSSSLPGFFRTMWAAPFTASVTATGLLLFRADRFWWCIPWLTLWMVAPGIAWFVSRPLAETVAQLTRSQSQYLRQLARRTWRYFETFVAADDNWLPPDNVHFNPDQAIASRTSPTNIGMALLANLTALDLGYSSVSGLIHRTRLTLETLCRLERYRGHLLNWYDTRTLEPLMPRYVSTVDSGNLAAQLRILSEGLQETVNVRVVPPQLFQGLHDTLSIFQHEATQSALTESSGSIKSIPPNTKLAVQRQLEQLNQCDHSIDMAKTVLHRVQSLAVELQTLTVDQTETHWWATALETACTAHLQDLHQLAAWSTISTPVDWNHLSCSQELTDKLWTLQIQLHQQKAPPTLSDVARLPMLTNPLITQILADLEACSGNCQSPSASLRQPHDSGQHDLQARAVSTASQARAVSTPSQDRDHAASNHSTAALSQSDNKQHVANAVRDEADRSLQAETRTSQQQADSHATIRTWVLSLQEAIEASSQFALSQIHKLQQLADECDEFSEMDFDFLHNTDRDLFSIGFNVSENRLDAGCYDLLASEARLASYLLISRGHYGQDHWFALGRLLTNTGGATALLSWSGSMFEYLMPLLVMPTYDHTLLHQTCRAIVQRQIQYGRQRGVPWGISESGYNAVDRNANYQYRAFGVPGLGLKRGLAEDLVIAPYATALALMVDPAEACSNLQRLSKDGREGPYGFFEAVDYTPSRLAPDTSSITVRQVMAHHAGMSLLAMEYVLLNKPMQRRFGADPEFRAVDLLLHERIPKATVPVFPHAIEASATRIASAEEAGMMRVFTDPDGLMPEVHLLSNGHYHVVMTHTGGGYSRWRGLAVTRWREDLTRDCWGTFCYLRDTESNDLWSTAWHPTTAPAKKYEAIFTQARAEYRRTDEQIETHTQVSVSSEDDVELRRVTLTNRSGRRRLIEVTSYAEVVLATQAQDESHPAFSNLFVQTEIIPSQRAVFCTRRPRSVEERPPWMIHLMSVSGLVAGETSFETDRMKFVGRGRSVANPVAFDQVGSLSNTAGATLDPIVSIRCTVILEPNESASIDIITGIAEERAGIQAMADKYGDPALAARVFELAWSSSPILLQQLNISETDAQVYGRLASSIVFASARRRANSSLLMRNRRGQSGLWGYGISGDLPIMLVRIRDADRIDLVRQACQAQMYWRMKGLSVDLVIWNEDESVYRQELQESIMDLLAASPEAALIDRPGGVFIRRGDQISDEDRILFQTVARVVLADDAGTLAEQVDRRGRSEIMPPAFAPVRRLNPIVSTTEPPARDLACFNGLGGFSQDGREYIIILPPGVVTPAPWVNVIANAQIGTVISESGSAYTWTENSHEFRLTPWNNDAVSDTCGEALYLRDEESGRYWSPSPMPARGRQTYITRHGFGYSIFDYSEDGIVTELCVYVSTDAAIQFARIKVTNTSGRTRQLSLTAFREWVLGDVRSKSGMHITTEIDQVTGAIFARNHYSAEFPDRVAFADCSETNRTFTCDRTEFLGRNGSAARPAALQRTRLSNRSGSGMDACAAIQTHFALEDHQEKIIVFTIGAATGDTAVRDLVQRSRGERNAQRALEGVWHYWSQTLGKVHVETPDQSVNFLTNGWLIYQTLACRMWARSGFYQSGGAYGFRDQLQDSMALIHAEPGLAREHLLRACSRQFREGDVQHWWHPPVGRGVRTHFSDDFLWLPLTLCRYVRTTGDTGVLNETIPFIRSRPLRDDEEANYDLPEVSDDIGTVYQHALRAVENGLRFGAHGLPLIGCGDWNDGMNLIGKDGKGESVWLAFFQFEVLNQFSELARRHGDEVTADRLQLEAIQLRGNIEQNAWDGQWYRRAYFDDGTPLGSAQNEECKIDAIAQAWSVLSEAGSQERSEQAMASVDRQLVRRDDRLIQLLDPPFDHSSLNPGYIKGYVPGVRENGGQYTHSAIWTIMAFAKMGETEKAWELFNLINPVNHGSTAEAIATYRVEPYVVAADVYGVAPHIGRGGWTWYTGSSGWMYRLITESLLGLTLDVNKLRFDPRPPKAWPSYKVHYRHHGTFYHINIINTGPGNAIQTLMLDGKAQPDHCIQLIDDHVSHEVEITLA